MNKKNKFAETCEDFISDNQIIETVSGSLSDKNFFSVPDFESDQIETCKTGDTCVSLSNDEFMLAIFGDIKGIERPVVTSFPGNPGNTGAWCGRPWFIDKMNLSNTNNNYTSFATFKPDNEGKYRRQKKQFAALYAVMLDDIGTKVPLDRISLKPSWMIETSKDNFQVGFILDHPLIDAATADRLLKTIIDAKLTDPGASGPCSRLGRLPVAINGKYRDDEDRPWNCELKSWQPQLRYSVQEIVDGLQIEIKETSQQRQLQDKKNGPSFSLHMDEVHIPRPDENPVISALKKSSRYKSPLGDGKHDITCPWLHEHTNQVDQGSAYFEPSEFYPLGGFKCMHGHCADRRVGDLYGFFDISKVEAKHKPMILVQPGELHRICDAAESELAKTLRYYQRGGVIVTITNDPSKGETFVKPLSLPSLNRALAGLVIWQRYDKRSNEWVVCDPPEKHARILHDATSYPHLPVLNGIARQPYLRPDGSLMLDAGYDASTGMFGVFNARQFNVPSSPTRQQAEIALSELSELLSEFAFKTESDKAAALAGILTAVIRSSLPQAPMFHVKAPSVASGKTYLCELLTAFATPQKGTPLAFPADDEECRKLLLAELLAAPAVIEFDNLTSDLIPHKSLCTALTSEFMSGRILGQSKTAEVGTRALFLSSGNNVDPVRDMARRTVTITLDPACETPATRDFLKQPVSEVRSDRGRYVSLVLTIVRAWHCAERPKVACKTIASYTDWSDYCRHSLLWLGLPDPASCIFESMNQDPDREQMGLMLCGWHNTFGNEAVMVRDAINRIDRDIDENLWEAIRDIALEKNGQINKNKLGWWLKRHAGRVVDGLRFVKDESNRGSAKWKTQVLPVLQVSNPALVKVSDKEIF